MGATQSSTEATTPTTGVAADAPNVTTPTGWFESYFKPSFLAGLGSSTKHRHRRPGPNGIAIVANLLVQKGLPLDLAHRVLDDARYWSVCTRECDSVCDVEARRPPPRTMAPAGHGWTNGQEGEMADVMAEGGLRDAPGKTWILVSGQVGCMSRRPGTMVWDRGTGGHRYAWLRRIVIDTFSRDQGWSDQARSYGTYDNSFSWFEVSLLRDGKEVTGTRRSIQSNVHAGQYFKPHRIVLEEHDDLVRQVREGDRVVLWARAEFPGWRNVVRESSIALFTTPYPPC